MGREIRKVPASWQHPKKEGSDRYQPQFEEYYGDAMNKWFKNHLSWIDGTHKDLIGDPTRKEKYPFFAMWDGGPPDVKYYRTVKYSEEELTHIQLYETTSEGTPISPVFHASQIEELYQYAAENCTTFGNYTATKEQWKEMLTNGVVGHMEGNLFFM